MHSAICKVSSDKEIPATASRWTFNQVGLLSALVVSRYLHMSFRPGYRLSPLVHFFDFMSLIVWPHLFMSCLQSSNLLQEACAVGLHLQACDIGLYHNLVQSSKNTSAESAFASIPGCQDLQVSKLASDKFFVKSFIPGLQPFGIHGLLYEGFARSRTPNHSGRSSQRDQRRRFCTQKLAARMPPLGTFKPVSAGTSSFKAAIWRKKFVLSRNSEPKLSLNIHWSTSHGEIILIWLD